MHRLLKRQLNKIGINPEDRPNPAQWDLFLDRIQQIFEQADQDRYTLERSLQISSEEMQELYQALKEASESQLAIERERLQHAMEIINNSPTVAFTWRNKENWPVEFVSENVQTVFGFTAADFMSGKVLYRNVVHPDDLERVAGEVLENSSHPNRTRFAHQPYRIITKSGVECWVDDRTFIRRDEKGKITHYQGTVLDITRRIVTQQEKDELEKKLIQSQKMEAIGMMAGGVAHDLNNILSGVVSYPDLLLFELPEDSELRAPLQVIKKAGKLASNVVTDLLTIARGIAGHREVASLNTLIIQYLESPEGQKLLSLYPNVRIKTDLAPDLSNIFCSPIHIRKCLMNLITNGTEAIEGQGVIYIKTENRHVNRSAAENLLIKTGEYIFVQVIDTGHGIDEENIKHIFDPFYTKKVMGRSGTGLGLAIVWNTIQEHGGAVSVSSNTQGTFFELYFPVCKEEIVCKKNLVSSEQLQGSGELILVVDDKQQQRDIASQMLSLLGYRVKTVASGEKAVDFIRDNVVDLLILDMIMDPGINGRQTYEQIIAIHPGQKAIIISGFSEDEEVKKAQKLGAGSFIRKPYTMEEISTAVEKALNKRTGLTE